MSRTIANVALVVADYDEAIAFYVDVLGFSLLDDTPLGDGKRWVRGRSDRNGNRPAACPG